MRFMEKRFTVSGYFYILKPQKTLLPKTGKLSSKGMRSSEKVVICLIVTLLALCLAGCTPGNEIPWEETKSIS